MGKHGTGTGAHAPRGRAARRRRRRRATRFATGTGAALTAAVLLALGPFGLPGSDHSDVGDATVVAQESPFAAAPQAPRVPKTRATAIDTATDRATGKAAASARRLPVAEAPAEPSPSVRAPRASRPGKARTKVPTSASGTYEIAPGRDKVEGKGDVVRYLVEVEKGLPFDAEEFAAEVHRILNSPAGWGHGGKKLRFQRVDSGHVRFRVSLSSPALTDSQCAPLRTYGKVSCYNGVRSVINAERWAHGAPTYPHDLAGYREYVISHEVGHAMGKDHVGCPHHGEPAPVMVQQTKSLEGCKANPWPFPANAPELDPKD